MTNEEFQQKKEALAGAMVGAAREENHYQTVRRSYPGNGLPAVSLWGHQLKGLCMAADCLSLDYLVEYDEDQINIESIYLDGMTYSV